MMKYFTLIMIGIGILYSCGSSQKAISNSAETETETQYPVVNAPVIINEEPKEEIEISVGTGTKISPNEDNEDEIIEEEIEIVETVEEVLVIEAFDHSTWDSLLSSYVTSDGVVSYKGFKSNASVLRNYIASLGDKMPDKTWSQGNTLAYWMNAYNAMTVDLIIRNYPLNSIKDIKDPWKQRLWKLGSKWYNLDEIEHQILRKMDEPRIHFGINCASFSCPPLGNKAFTANNVDDMLDQLARDFINDSRRNKITADKISISKIFSWFSKDFKKNGSVIDYLNKYSEIPISSKARKSFMDYDWNLNN